MRLGDLTRRLEGVRLSGPGETEVLGISHDSRKVGPGYLFAAFPGARAHGLEFLDQAIANGAAAVLTDRPAPPSAHLPWLLSPVPRRHAAVAAWALAGDPQHRLLMAGITGTNGKSTSAQLLAGMLQTAGTTAGLFGTLTYTLPDSEVTAERTTPEAADLAPLLARLADAGGRAAVMEVSSHALALERVAGLTFDVAAWTNLSRDHLDFHGDMESYFAVKRRLFDELLAAGGRRVLPLGDGWAARLLEEPRDGDVTYGIGEGMVRALEPRYGLDGTTFLLETSGKIVPAHLPLIGEHNLRNALTAAAAAHAAGIPAEAVRGSLAEARPLPGRLEPVPVELGFPVFVDYAHTPDGLRAVLGSLRAVTDRRLIVVFGAGGDRDPGKRGPMGEAVGELADLAIVTSDNPRSEPPEEIAAAVAEGVRTAGAEPRVELDRRAAIAHALAAADGQSLVIIAGKGHEAEQIIGDRRVPFSDVAVVLELAGGAGCG